MAKQITYSKRDFASIKQELVTMTNQYYPDLISNFNDASIYSVLLDLNAAVTDNLHHNIDRVWQETMLDFAQQKLSLYYIAKTYGLKIPGNKPSVALCDFSIIVPVRGDKEDERYQGILKSGAQVSGGGQVFETIYDIDFSSPFNNKGESNRLKIPNFNENNQLVSYTITKREVVVNGITRIFRKIINETDQTPYLNVFLPEQNVLGVVSVIEKQGTSFVNNPAISEFYDNNLRWWEVENLAENKIFVPKNNDLIGQVNVIKGENRLVTKKFITEYTPLGYFFLTFGSGNRDPLENFEQYMDNNFKINLSDYIDMNHLGEKPKVGTTLFIKYRVGGGKTSVLGQGVLTTLENYELVVNGPNEILNTQVSNSLTTTNVTPTIGGADQPTLEDIRHLIKYNFAAQKRAVTLNDYKSLINSMPSIYGAPAKVNVIEFNNKVLVTIVSYDENGSLNSTVSSILKDNILEYLSNYKMVNDMVGVNAGEIIDLGLEIDLIIDRNVNQTDILKESFEKTIKLFDVSGRELGQPLYVGNIIKEIGNIVGVIQVVDVRVFNKVGGQYSNAMVNQTFVNDVTREIKQKDFIITMNYNQIYQIRFPNKDIKIRVKTVL